MLDPPPPKVYDHLQSLAFLGYEDFVDIFWGLSQI